MTRDLTVTRTAPSPTPSLSLLLRRCEEHIDAALAPHLRAHSLSRRQWRILSALDHTAGLGPTEISLAAVVPVGTLSRQLDLLVAAGLVSREADPDDHRRIRASLSPTGTAVAAQLREVERDAEATVSPALQARLA